MSSADRPVILFDSVCALCSADARIVPAALRDPVYRWVARNRYRLFGRRETCWLPGPELADRCL